MRFVGDGISVAELPDATGIPRARTLSTLGGMERWRYVTVGPDPETRRDGFGSARGLRPDWVVRPTPAGLAAAAIWRPLADEIEERWAERFGAAAIGELRLCLQPIAGRPELALPESMPIVGGSSWTLADTVSGGTRGDASRAPLSTLLSQCAPRLHARVRTRGRARVAAQRQRRPRPRREGREREGRRAARRDLEGSRGDGDDLPREATATWSWRRSSIRLTALGSEAQTRAEQAHGEIGALWATQGTRLGGALADLLDRKDLLALALRPDAGGWRSSKPYLAQTEARLEDPTGTLPHYPMVLHRGGWPDGS